ncbi:T/G mismatch-specific endonuclease [Salinibacterium xinjiangense]|uniref:Very short patch repair endonuclease n=1 Tax=Salinibacterium xinjiangense TaxID=386302 RepID=A0A2C8ZB27_9MICO|nr:very short patch repair endonuclease [Salinibacterium xinjiangense]SOE61368.1 T/G mismatch-specific endonuclease [Salinibacterium xinjiangense]
MADVHSPEQRSRNMAGIRSANTKPELRLRRALHAQGFRYRLNSAKLPGKPDLVFPSRKKVIFVNGCFWHVHDCRYGQVVPATRPEFWAEKRNGTVGRDARKNSELEALGWQVHTVWECELRIPEQAIADAVQFLKS